MRLILLTLLSATAVLTWGRPALEVKFIVDQLLVDTYKKLVPMSHPGASDDQVMAILKQDIDYVLGEAKQIFDEQKKFGIDVELRVVGDIEFLGKNLIEECCETPYSQKITNAVLAWGRENMDDKMDFTLLLSGYTVQGSTIGGNAYTGGVCSVYTAGGWIHFDGTRAAAMRAVHELSHGLGAPHDSDRNYLMAAFSTFSATSESFSGSSANAIKENANKGNLKCLQTIDADSRVPEEQKPRKELTDNEFLCKWAFKSPKSYIEQGYIDNLCYGVWCHDPQRDRARATYNDGNICGKGKRCQNRQCVPSSDPESDAVNEKCMFGDQKRFKLNGAYQTCADDKYICHYYIGDKVCCETCKVQK